MTSGDGMLWMAFLLERSRTANRSALLTEAPGAAICHGLSVSLCMASSEMKPSPASDARPIRQAGEHCEYRSYCAMLGAFTALYNALQRLGAHRLRWAALLGIRRRSVHNGFM